MRRTSVRQSPFLRHAFAYAAALAACLAAAPAVAQPCIGDCGVDGEVTVDEVLTGLNIALGLRTIDECEAMDADGSRSVTVDEIITALSLALTGCPGSDPTRTPTPTRTATPRPSATLPPNATATASRTPTATLPPSVGPVITYFGLARADRQAVAPSGVTDAGIPIIERPFGGGFLIVVEGRPGTSQVPLGQCNTSYDEFDPSVVPDIQILSSRDLGRGDPAVCDGEAIQPTGFNCGARPPIVEPPGGGVPAVDPPDFDAGTTTISNALNDFGCRMSYKGLAEPCTLSAAGNPRYLGTGSTDQFCTENVVSPGDLLFPPGDTILTARLRDNAGNVSAPRQIVVRIPSTANESWTAGTALPSLADPDDAGFLDLRGAIHAHSYYSHDACDDMPVVDGVRDEQCFADLRRGMCQTRHDFMMFTDHPSDFRDAEFPDALLYRANYGDVLVERNGGPVASWAGCEDVDPILVLAGSESSRVMPVGLEGHVAADPAERGAVYSSDDPADAARMRAQGAVILLAHPEMFTVDELAARDVDGFEMYNLHANLLRREALGAAFRLLQRLNNGDPGLPHPDLALLPLVLEDDRYLDRWGSLLARGLRRVTTLGTDVHRNTLPTLMQDGERVDSYRRLLLWFSNHLLVTPESDGSWDDRHLKEALRSGRLYGAFEMLGYPEGFEFSVQVAEATEPMGAEVSLAHGPVLQVRAPSVRGLAADREPPELSTRILQAVEGGFVEVARSGGDLAFTPAEPGAYRAEVRMVPLHLREDLGADADTLLARDYVWIYANPIYVTADA